MWFILLITTLILVQYWKLALLALSLIVAWKTVAWVSSTAEREIAAQREAERHKIQRLIDNATKEHRYVQQGDIRGVYGDFNVPEETRGLGIWLTDK
jgi:hypothetical protein